MGRVGAVIPPDHQQKVEWLGKKFSQRILALLGGTADCIKKAEVRIVSIPGDNRVAEQTLHGLGLFPKHRGLVGDADSCQVLVRIKSLRESSGKFGEEFLPPNPSCQKFADTCGLFQVKDDQILTVTLAQCP